MPRVVFPVVSAVSAALLWGTLNCLGDVPDSRVTNSNIFMDTLLINRMPNYVRYAMLEPAQLESMEVVVNTKNWAGHKFKANFTTNTVTGLEHGVRRFNNCYPLRIDAGNITVACNIHFRGVQIFLDGFGTGDSTLKATHQVTASATMANSYALVEVAGPRSHEPGSLIGFTLAPLNFTVTQGPDIGLGKDRAAEFQAKLKEALSPRVSQLFLDRYQTALAKAVKTVNLPPV